MTRSRLASLDGLRGLAILLVLLFHFFRPNPAHPGLALPYGDLFANWLPVRDGFTGVYLFFLISGFVILRSLQGSASWSEFVRKRANRLVLPMLVISTLTFFVLTALPTPSLAVRWADFLPSWAFSDPRLFTWLDPQIAYINGSYWTLFAEVRFYLLAALLWFFVGRSAFTPLLSGFAVVALGSYLAAALAGLHDLARLLDLALFPDFAGLFACGAVYAEIHRRGLQRGDLAILGVLIPASLLGACLAPGAGFANIDTALWVLAFHAVFICFALGHSWTRVFSFKPLAGLGLVSYSLYLLHESVGLAVIWRIPAGWSLGLQLLAVGVTAAALLGLAILSWRVLERVGLFRPPARQFLDVAPVPDN